MINSVNTETQRKSARTKVASNEIVYLHFQTGNGGIVLDISAEGLGFQAADPLQAHDPLSFRLSVPGFPEVALSGQIVWLDSTRKRGGMRLTVPAESLALFEQWQRKYLDSAAEADRIPASAKPNAAPARGSQQAPRVKSRTEGFAPATARPARNETPPGATAEPEPPRAGGPAPPNPLARRQDSLLGAHGPIFVSEWEAPPESPRTGRNILVACVIVGLCVVVAGGSYYFAGKRAVGSMLIDLGQKIGGTNPHVGAAVQQPANNGSPSALGATAPGAPSSPPPLAQNGAAPGASAGAPSATIPDGAPAPAATSPPQSTGANPSVSSPSKAPPQAAPAMNANVIPANSGGASKLDQRETRNRSSNAAALAPLGAQPRSRSHGSASIHASQPAAGTGDGAADLTEALRYLQSPNGQDAAVAAELLWSAVGEGSTQADLVLGDLYMRGQGAVHRNCRQAEILLHAALVADVPGANEKVDELQTYGCR